MHSIKVFNQCLLTETSIYCTSKAHLQGLTGLGSWLGGWRWKLSSTSSCEGLRSEAVTPVVIHAAGAHAVVLPACSTSVKINMKQTIESIKICTQIMGSVRTQVVYQKKTITKFKV